MSNKGNKGERRKEQKRKKKRKESSSRIRSRTKNQEQALSPLHLLCQKCTSIISERGRAVVGGEGRDWAGKYEKPAHKGSAFNFFSPLFFFFFAARRRVFGVGIGGGFLWPFIKRLAAIHLHQPGRPSRPQSPQLPPTGALLLLTWLTAAHKVAATSSSCHHKN